MVEHLPIERASAEAEVRRYCAWPTYQLCYAVGRREILAPARRLPRRGGLRRYQPEAFHDELLSVRRTAGRAGAMGDGSADEREVGARSR